MASGSTPGIELANWKIENRRKKEMQAGGVSHRDVLKEPYAIQYTVQLETKKKRCASFQGITTDIPH